MWIALFSQTGTEIVNIAEELGYYPDEIHTSNSFENINDKLKPLVNIGSHEDILGRLNDLSNVDEDVMVTLHGYLRILPKDTCLLPITIFNGHPAPIHLYPNLKGFNKQEDQFNHKEDYARIGVVIYEVTPELDGGQIVLALDEPNNLTSVDDAYDTLRELSLRSWLMFLKT